MSSSSSSTGLWARLKATCSDRLISSFQRFASPGDVTRLVFLDFDHTLTVIHVFKALAGWMDDGTDLLGVCGAVAKPYAITERGQLSRLNELGPAWNEQAFGGPARVAEIRELLAHLSGPLGCRVILITRGYIGVVKKSLSAAGLLEYFSDVFGNVGQAYGDGTVYDRSIFKLNDDLEQFLGGENDGQWTSKSSVVIAHKISSGLTSDQVVLVDDDVEEIWSVNHCVHTVHVKGPSGMQTTDVRELLRCVGADLGEAWAQASLQRWALLPDALTSRPPSILLFNRSQLPMLLIFVLLRWHLHALEAELDACPNAVRRIKLLLKEPLLLLSIAQRELARHAQRGKDDPFSVKKNLRPLVQRMHAQAGLQVESEILENKDAPFVRKGGSCENFSRLWSPGTEASLPWSREVSMCSVGGVAGGLPPISSGNSLAEAQGLTRGDSSTPCSQKLYRAPMNRIVSDPATALRAAVTAFQKDLLGLCPITASKVGVRRNGFGTHHTKHSDSLTVWTRYEAVQKLGAGHFGEVYKATEVCSGRLVAVKQLERLEHHHPEDREEVEGVVQNDEVSTLRSLAHPNLLRVYEVVKGSEHICIISEFADGGTLLSFMDSDYSRSKALYSGKKVSDTWVPGAIQQITCAVAYCHRFNVLHGDLKPENVLVHGLRPDGSPLCIVCDFGHTAICIGARTRIAAPGDPRYIAPEVVAEEGLSPKSDIWMLGVTAYELLTGGWLPFFNQKSVTLASSYYQLKFGDVRDKILSEEGLDWREKKRLEGASLPARQAVTQMLTRSEDARPSATEILRSEWLLGAQAPCKAAYDEMLSSAGKDSGWGLWKPHHPRFAERLSMRAERMERTSTYGLLLGLLGSGFDESKVRGVRLLFRRMDYDGSGTIDREKFYQASKRANLPQKIAERLFDCGSWIHDRKFLDFKNLVTLMLDLDALSNDGLERELRSVLNRIRGPCHQYLGAPVEDEPRKLSKESIGPAKIELTEEEIREWQQKVLHPSMSIDDLSSMFVHQDTRIKRFLDDTRRHLGEEGEVTASLFRVMLRDGL